MNILPDINCPHCGWVIVCPHFSGPMQTARGNENDPASLFGRLAARRADTRSFSTRLEERASGTRRSLTQPQRRTEVGDIAQPGMNPKYVEAAIRRDLDRLAGAHEGVRNATLHSVACNVFEFVKGGHANVAAARAELERIAAAIGLPDSEIRTTLRSAWQRVQPRQVPAPASAAAYTIESPTS